MSKYVKYLNLGTPQSQPTTPVQVKNDPGMYVFKPADEALLRRFLLLGSESGTYYAGERELTAQSLVLVKNMLASEGLRVLQIAEEMVEMRRLPKQDTALLILALASASKDPAVRSRAYQLVTRFARTSTHLFMFLSMVQSLRGWSRGLRTAVGKFYTGRSAEDIAYQILKYRSREGWTHRDVLRLTHIKPVDAAQGSVIRYAAGYGVKMDMHPVPSLVTNFEKMQDAGVAKKDKLQLLVDNPSLTWEMVPTDMLKDPEVWKTLAPRLNYTALLRNLARMTSLGLLGAKSEGITTQVADMILNVEAMRRGNVHPAAILNALNAYARGYGDKGSLSWNPSGAIKDALEKAFELSTSVLVPTNKRILVSVDVSGSMQMQSLGGLSLTSAASAAALAASILKSEPKADLAFFNTAAKITSLGRTSSYNEILSASRIGGGTDCSATYRMALEKKLQYDAIVVLTDSQTTGGEFHPYEAWDAYRSKVNPNAKTVIVGMASNNFTILPPDDVNAMTVTGFDTMVPNVIAEFIGRG